MKKNKQKHKVYYIVYFMLALVNITACTFLATFELFCQVSIALPSKNAFARYGRHYNAEITQRQL